MIKTTITSLLLLLFTAISLNGQVYVDNNGNVSVGSENSGSAKLHTTTVNENIGLQISNNSLTASSSRKYGLYNTVGENEIGEKRGTYNYIKQNNNSSAFTYGSMNFIYSYGQGSGIGIFNAVSQGTGRKIGIENIVTQNTSSNNTVGIKNTISPGVNGTGGSYGIYNYQNKGGHTGISYGIYSKILDTPNTNTNNVSAMFSSLTHEGSNLGYGWFSSLTSKGGSSGHSYGIFSRIDGPSTRTRYGVYSNINGGTGYAGYFVGDVHVDGCVTHCSDENLKENINDINGALDLMEQLVPKTYNFKKLKNHGNDSSKKNYGFLAQDLEKILPELVSTIEHPGELLMQDGLEQTSLNTTDEMDEFGNPSPSNSKEIAPDEFFQTPNSTIKAINYNGLIPLLVQAIKEQQKEFSTIKNEQEKQYEALATNYLELQKGFLELKSDLEKLKNCVTCETFINGQNSIGSSQHFKVFPNPTDGYFTIHNSEKKQYTVNVYNGTGSLIFNQEQVGQNYKVDSSKWPAGTYFLSIIQNNQLSFQEKIVIIH